MAYWTPTSWATAVLKYLGAPITQNNIDNITRWMRAEKGADWFNRNNPLNSSVGTDSIDGTGSYPNLGVAARNVAGMINQGNMSGIKQALMSNAPLPTFSAAVVESPWASSHYGGNPSYFTDVPPLPNTEAPVSAGTTDLTPPTTVDSNPTTSTGTGSTGTGSTGTGTSAGTYTVQAGNTLWGIAKQYGIPVAALIAANPQITNPNLIFPGNVINIPQQSSSPRTPPPRPKPVTKPITRPGSRGSGGRIFVDINANLSMAGRMQAHANQLGDIRLSLLSVASRTSPPPPQVSGLLNSLNRLLDQLNTVTTNLHAQAKGVIDNARGLAAEERHVTSNYTNLGHQITWPDMIWDVQYAGSVPGFLRPLFEFVDAELASLVSLPKTSFPSVLPLHTAPVEVPTAPVVSSTPVSVGPVGSGILATSIATAGVTVAQEEANFAKSQIYWNGPYGRVLLNSSQWLGGHGIDVHSDAGTNYKGHYQCVTLVTDLFRERGWIHGSWLGNGNTLLNSLPPGVTKQLNGHITHLVPGDAVSMQVAHDGVTDQYGHAVVVNQIIKCSNGYMVQFVNQNSPTVYTYGTLSPSGVLTMNPSGSWSYDIIGVAHATANTG